MKAWKANANKSQKQMALGLHLERKDQAIMQKPRQLEEKALMSTRIYAQVEWVTGFTQRI